MTYYRQTILHQIKSASNKAAVEEVINDSIERLKIKNVNGHIIQRFILSMGPVLHREISEQPSSKALENMGFAIDVFRRLQKP